MYSSRANFWAPKTQSPNGLRVTLVKKRSLQPDHGVDQPSRELPAPKLNSVPRWAIESNKNPCKLVIKRRKTMETSDSSLVSTCTSGAPSLKVRIVASKRARRDGKASFARIKNWCKEQITTSLPSTCYDSYFAAADVTLQPSPKCILSETLLSGELFHLQPSPKDSGIDVSSPPRRLDEMHLADMSCFSMAAGPITEVSKAIAGKLYRANVHCQKTLSAKQQNIERNVKKTVAEGTDVEFTNPSNSLMSPGLSKHEPFSKKTFSPVSSVSERNCLLVKLPTSAFPTELKGSDNKTKIKKLKKKIIGEQLSTVDKSDSKSPPEAIPKQHQRVQNNKFERSYEKHCNLKISSEVESESYSASLHKFKSKTVRRSSVETVRELDCKVHDGLKEAKSVSVSAEVNAERRNLSTSEKFDHVAVDMKRHKKRNQIFPRIKTKIEILDKNYSISGTDAPKNAMHSISNESKITNNKIKKDCHTAVTGKQHVSTVIDAEEMANEKTIGTICRRNVKNQISSAESKSPSEGCHQTNDKKHTDISGQVASKMGVKINLRKQISTLRDSDIGRECETATGSAVKSNLQKITEKAAVSMNSSETLSDLDRNLKTRRSKLTFDIGADKKISCKNQDCLSPTAKDQVFVKPSAEDGCSEDKSECNTVPLATNAVMTSSSVPLRPKRFTRSSVNKQLAGPISDIPVTHRDLEQTSLDDSCSRREQHLHSSVADFPKTTEIINVTDSPCIHEGSAVKRSEIESTETTLDVLSDKLPRSNCSAHVKKRRAGSRNSASRRSFERHFNSRESRKLPAIDDLLTAAQGETKNEVCNLECVSFTADNTNRNENKTINKSPFSDCEIIEIEPPLLCSFSPQGCEDELLLSTDSKSCFDEVDRILANTSLSALSDTKSPQEISEPHSENLSWQNENGDNTVDHEKLFNPVVTLFEPPSSNSSAFTMSPGSNPKFNTKPVNNYFDEFAKFVTVQHLNSDSSHAGDVACSALVSAEEIDLSSFDEEMHSDIPAELDKFLFSQSSLHEVYSELNPHKDSEASVRTSQLLTHEFSRLTPCSASKSILSEDGLPGHPSVRNVEHLTVLDRSISANENTVDCCSTNNGTGEAVFDDTLITDDFCIDSFVSVDQELKSLQVKVTELLRTVFPGLLQNHREPNFLTLPRFLNQVLDAVLCDADDETDLQKCHCDCYVTLCRNPLTCLEQFQTKVLRFLRCLVPSSSLEDVETKELELLVEAVTLANSAELVQDRLGDNSDGSLHNVHYRTSCKPCTYSDDIAVCASDVESLQTIANDDGLRRHQ